jgi:oligopeptide transport system permease protein
VEYIFAIPGMGRFFVVAVSNRDYPLIMGITLVYTVILVLANLVVDLLYVLIDPRIKFSRSKI